MRRRFGLLIGCCGVLAVCWSARAQDATENPVYTSWAKYKPGTSVTLATDSSAAGQHMKMETKSTLSEVTADKVVVEMAMSMDVNGTKMTQPPTKMEIKKTVDPTPTPAPNAQPPVNAKTIANATEESVTVAAGTYKAKVVESTMTTAGSNIKSKVWFSPEVPGGTVKMTAVGDGPMNMDVKTELTAIDKK